MFPANRLLCLASLAVVATLVSGCANLEVNDSSWWKLGMEEEPEVPTDLTAVWTNTVRNTPNRPSTRGFGGRIMFYNGDKDRPVKVEGTLVVYAFDETGGNKGDVKATRKNVFTPEQLAAHYGKSQLGHSYSIWVPWDRSGGPTADVSLIVRFTSTDGSVVVGSQTTHVLPGPAPKTAENSRKTSPGADGVVRTVSHEGPLTDELQRKKMTTTSISIPTRFGNRTPVAAVRPRPALYERAPSTQGISSAPQQSAAGTEPQAYPSTSGPQPTRLPPARSQVPDARIARPGFDRTPWRPAPGVSPFDRQSSLPSAVGSEFGRAVEDVAPAMR